MPAVRARNLTRRAGLSTCRASNCGLRRSAMRSFSACDKTQQRAKHACEGEGVHGQAVRGCRRSCGAAGKRRCLGAVEFPDQTRAHLCAISARRRRRHSVAHARRRRLQAMGPVGHRREPSGRGRRGRLASAGAVAARRLHVDHGGERPSRQSIPLSEAALRHLQGFYADLAARIVAEHPAGPRGTRHSRHSPT